ncbi:hypothetical protein [Actinoplanes sp. NPDC051859]|uniref:hypothetical protein n=1 Tax=Actinoplanes sp. NPDC051859 TaxID=3363909 RepID=UPI0037888DBC
MSNQTFNAQADESFKTTIKDPSQITPEMALRLGGITQTEYDAYKRGLAGAEHYNNTHLNPRNSGYTWPDDAKAARDKYMSWKDEYAKKEQEVGSALGDNSGYQSYDPEKDYSNGKVDPKAGNKPEGLPDVPPKEEVERRAISADQHALLGFKERITTLQDLLKPIRTEINTLLVTPGSFGAGWNLSSAVNGDGTVATADGVMDADGGLRAKLYGALKRIDNVFTDIKDDVDTVIKQYDTVEELNDLTSDQLNRLFRESFGEVDPPAAK